MKKTFILSAILFLFISLSFIEDDELKISFQDICWSPDGKTIYFSAMKVKPDYSDFKPEKWNIYKYDFATKTTSKFIDSAYYVSVSPSGKQIAVGKRINGNRDILIYDSNGKNPKRITTDPADDFGATFSPDEKQIAFNSKQSGKPEIYLANTDGSLMDNSAFAELRGSVDKYTKLRRITFSNGFSSYNPAWSPDGKYIAYYFEKGDHKDQIRLMNPDGTNDKNITNDTLNNTFPNWIDKNKIVYAQNKKAFTLSIEEMNLQNPQPQPLNIESFCTRFSPDGKMIAFINNKEKCIEVITAEGKPVTKIFLPD
ncbi:MAG: PD40 domain-containing protein [Bacteroidetes bacterium]|nr:PD40 domain-containing protein [Bacteroidota bacterium]